MTAVTPLNVAVLGAGNRAQDHLQTISRLDSLCRLVGVCDADGERIGPPALCFGYAPAC